MKRVALIVILMLISVSFLGIIGGSTSTGSMKIVGSRPRGNTIIFTNTTWTLANSPYKIIQDVQIASNVTLTIEAGVQIQFKGEYEILVKGSIIAKGTASKRIIFIGTGNPPDNSSTPSLLKFKGTNLNNSQLDYIKMEKAWRAIQIGQETEHNQGEKNRGTLTVSNIIFNEANVITDGYDTGAKLVISDAKISSSTIKGNYPRSEEIIIKNSIISDSVINSDSYNRGITIEKCNITNTDLKIGCCGANFQIIDSIITDSIIDRYNNHYFVDIISSRLINTPINLPDGRYVTISDSIIAYHGNYGITARSLMMDSSNIIGSSNSRGNSSGNGSGNSTSVGIIITGNRDNNPNKITNSSIAYNAIGIDVTDADSLTIQNCNIINNSNYNIRNKAKVNIDATNNYWGTTNKNEISDKIFDYYDDINYGKVIFEPFLTSPVNISMPYIPPKNQQPIANAGSDQTATVNQTVNFDGSGSYDPDGDPLTFKWSFGDGTSTGWQNSSKASHVYSRAGNYTVTLTVSDGELIDEDTCLISVTGGGTTPSGGTDTDKDGLIDAHEILFFIDPTDPDSDDDGLLDGQEGLDTSKSPNDRANDPDNDGFHNAIDADSDGDGILDGTEAGLTEANINISATDQSKGHFFPDQDPPSAHPGEPADKYTTDPTNWDTDGDTLSDGDEDRNKNGKYEPTQEETNPNFKDFDNDGLHDDTDDLDDDNDGMPDSFEKLFSNACDPLDASDKDEDYDGDGYTNYREYLGNDNKPSNSDWSDPENPNSTPLVIMKDSDNDGVPDNNDRFPNDPNEWEDSDDDGVGDNTDKFKLDMTQWNDTDGDGYGDNPNGNSPDRFPNDPTQWEDIDGDGHGDNPWGTDGDYYPSDPAHWQLTDEDINEDIDGDGIPDKWELSYGLNPNDQNDALLDLDNDLLTNLEEYKKGTNPKNCDTDNDGYNDKIDAFPTDFKRFKAEPEREGLSWNNFIIIFIVIIIVLVLIILKLSIIVFNRKHEKVEKPRNNDILFHKVIHEVLSTDKDTDLTTEEFNNMLERKFQNGEMSAGTYHYMKDFIQTQDKRKF